MHTKEKCTLVVIVSDMKTKTKLGKLKFYVSNLLPSQLSTPQMKCSNFYHNKIKMYFPQQTNQPT